MTDSFKSIGEDLLEHADHTAFTAQRSVLEELFPYILQASQRMSARAIGRWLQDKHGVKFSFVAVARALREKEKHLLAMVERIEPAARCFASGHNVSMGQFLFDRELFDHLRNQPPVLAARDGADVAELAGSVDRASMELEEHWFAYPKDVLRECRPFVPEATIKPLSIRKTRPKSE
jgi:hypothetical protein